MLDFGFDGKTQSCNANGNDRFVTSSVTVDAIAKNNFRQLFFCDDLSVCVVTGLVGRATLCPSARLLGR